MPTPEQAATLRQVKSLSDAISVENRDVGPWGNGYAQALDDLDAQIRLRFGDYEDDPPLDEQREAGQGGNR